VLKVVYKEPQVLKGLKEPKVRLELKELTQEPKVRQDQQVI
jgi:hypothetical protein